LINDKNYTLTEGQTMGPMVLFSGCKTADSDLHAKEKAAAVKEGILDRAFLALSRGAPLPKVSYTSNY